jgi:hypothetical protein
LGVPWLLPANRRDLYAYSVPSTDFPPAGAVWYGLIALPTIDLPLRQLFPSFGSREINFRVVTDLTCFLKSAESEPRGRLHGHADQ